MANKFCVIRKFVWGVSSAAVALFLNSAAFAQSEQLNFDVRKNYSGNPNAVAFSGGGAAAGNKVGSGYRVISAGGGAADSSEQLPPARVLAEKKNFADIEEEAEQAAVQENEADLAKKKEALRKKTLANYSDVVADDDFQSPVPLPTKKAKPAEKAAAKEVAEVKLEKQVTKAAEETSKTKPAVAIAGTVYPDTKTDAKKEEVKIIRTDVKKVAGEAVAEADKKADVGTAEAAVGQADAVAKAVSKDPACANAELEAGRARTASTQADKLFYLRRASRLCPNYAGYHIEIGQVYAALNRKEDARFSYNKALEIDPDNAEAKKLISGLK